ncbi:hypothetical protein BGP_5171 [Beggiatoa sp. PS]|nr:hypothetical protein BGP_5171 [Beggiatoa sp. PS]
MSNYFESIHHINTESLQQLLLDELSEFHLANRIHILLDNGLVRDNEKHFLLQIDDYDIRLNFLAAPTGKPTLDLEKLSQFNQLLADNPNTVALIVAWTTEDLQSIPFSTTRIQHLIQYPQQLSKLIQTAKPLAIVIKTLIARQFKFWEIQLEPTHCGTTHATDIRRIFEQAMISAIQNQQNRSYRYTERQRAARQFPVEEEQKFILSVLEKALEGKNSQELVHDLVSLRTL